MRTIIRGGRWRLRGARGRVRLWICCRGLISGLRRIPRLWPSRRSSRRIAGTVRHGRRRGGFRGRRGLHYRCSRPARRPHFCQFWSRHGHAGMLLENLLSGTERRRRWWRRRFGDHRTAHYSRWRSCYAIRRIRMWTEHGLRSRRHRSSRSDGPGCHLSRIHGHGHSRNGLRTGKCLLRNRRDSSLHIAVHIRHIVDGGVVVDNRCVVDVRDGSLINRRVANVHTIHIRRAHAVRRNVDLTRTEREPSYGRTGSESAADECDQGRGIYRSLFARTGYPSPTSIKVCPAAVVERSISPTVVVDPRPSPWIDPRPMALVVRSPSGLYVGKPNVTVIRSGAPVAVFVEIFESDHATGTIAG